MIALTLSAVFIIGLIIGSFLNVLILRLHSGESAASGRSKCPQCGHVLRSLDLVPVLSYLLLRGRCRYCRAEISWQYPAVELAAGLLFAFSYYLHASPDFLPTWLMLRDVAAICPLIVIFVYDLRWMIIPDSIALPAIVAAAVAGYLCGLSPLAMISGALAGFGFFALQYVVSRGTWIGGGDLRLGALMGVLLGWPLISVAIFLSYMLGALVSAVLLLRKRVTGKTALPFGVFLAPSALAALFWGSEILAWYLGKL